MQHVLACNCGTYTLKPVCPSCGAATISPRPPKYSPDKYAEYRRAAKQADRESKGLL